MNAIFPSILGLLLAGAAAARAQDAADGAARGFDQAALTVEQKLEAAVAELDVLREQVTADLLPLSTELSQLEAELATVEEEYRQTTRLLDTRTLDLQNLRSEIEKRVAESSYVQDLMAEYAREFDSRLHIAEDQLYEEELDDAQLAVENQSLSRLQVLEAQNGLVSASIERIEELLGGRRFDGTAVDPDGLVNRGTFLMVGPWVVFRSSDGRSVGFVEQRLPSLEPSVFPFADPADTAAGEAIVRTGAGEVPFDSTLGNAYKVESTNISQLEEIQKGGPVMYPIFALAGAALLVALYKWLSLLFVARPSQKRIQALLHAVSDHDEEEVSRQAAAIRGPIGRMLQAGVEHMKEPRELIEEVMYEKVLTTRFKLERMLPFIAICAAAAPLLGLLGTVTGIISTFKLITVFGSGDVKSLSGGISEALITTKFGLIVAIPSLLLHAYLSRKARGVIGQMEAAAVAFVNQVSKTPFEDTLRTSVIDRIPLVAEAPNGNEPAAEVRPGDALRAQVREILNDLLTPVVSQGVGRRGGSPAPPSGGP